MATIKTSTTYPRVTKTVVENATPGTVWDRDLKGYGVRISPKGVRSYFVHHRLPGWRQVAVTLGRHGSPWTAEQARAPCQAAARSGSVRMARLGECADGGRGRTDHIDA